ncbi:MAG TPA: hypothetical protein VIM11_19670 [Tepidisphaeraceae bacterium]|jgi:hypothetical protein
MPNKKLTATDSESTAPAASPKYSKPRILAIDLNSDLVRSMKAAGYNVDEGTFGSAYHIPRSDGYRTVTTGSADLPDLNEQEILIVDLDGADWTDAPNVDVTRNIQYFWQSCAYGRITPRALAMYYARASLEKVFSLAGICIVLTSPKATADYRVAKWDGHNLYDEKEALHLSNWGFLSGADAANVEDESGREMHFLDGPLSAFLQRFSADGSYTCTFEYSNTETAKWVPLAKNKYGSTVAGLRLFVERSQFILLLPRLPRLADAMVELLERFVASWRPDLFPHLESAKWVHRPEYELPAVTQLERQVDDVEAQAKKAVEALQSQIATLRKDNADWYMLLCGTGDELAQVIIRSLRILGFQNVIDVDEEEKKKGNQSSLREDIQIHDTRPVLVIDVKGINDCPSDDEATQSLKHATMRMREWKHTEVKPLTIVNHQRHLPPLDRSAVVYRSEIVGNAEQQELGLMTTWDLFRILRNKEHLGWPEDATKAIFYRTGLIRPVPAHYQYIGTIAKAWSDKFGVVIEEQELRVGDRIAVEFPILFEETEVGSIRVNDQNVQHAKPGDPAGVLWDESKPKVRKGMKVYRIAKE